MSADAPKATSGMQSSDYTLEPDTLVWWTTPILRRSCPGHDEINVELKTLIHEKMASSDGVYKSNEGGWHSDEDLLTWGGTAIAQLQNWIVGAFQDINQAISGGQIYGGKLELNAWASVNRCGDYNSPHTHPACVWSGVYYVDVGAPVEDSESKAGTLEFLDPRAGTEMMVIPGAMFGLAKVERPVTGDIVVFPSWLRHQVHPYAGEGERISIAFNIRIRPDQ
jgi:uncharacterized protein (TIGR02466 family)